MKKKYLLIVSVLAIIAASTLVVALGNGQTVGQNAYGGSATITASASSVCIGNTITISGSGVFSAGATVFVHLEAAGFYGLLGTPVSDANGNWSLTTTIPHTLVDDQTGATLTVTPGNYGITGREGGGNMGVSQALSVLSCNASLPNTGLALPFSGLWLLTGILVVSGLGVGGAIMLRK